MTAMGGLRDPTSASATQTAAKNVRPHFVFRDQHFSDLPLAFLLQIRPRFARDNYRVRPCFRCSTSPGSAIPFRAVDDWSPCRSRFVAQRLPGSLEYLRKPEDRVRSW